MNNFCEILASEQAFLFRFITYSYKDLENTQTQNMRKQ